MSDSEQLIVKLGVFVKAIRRAFDDYGGVDLNKIPANEVIRWTDELLSDYEHYINSKPLNPETEWSELWKSKLRNTK
jgi:hypothetical protein